MVYLSSHIRLFGLPCSLTNQILYILQRNCLFFWILLEDRTLKFGTLSVSYTHLDVYKRQVHSYCLLPYSCFEELVSGAVDMYLTQYKLKLA